MQILTALAVVGFSLPAQAATVSGTIYRDINADGQFNNTGVTAEPGIGGVTLAATDELGNSITATSNATTGAYSVTLAGNQLRIEATTPLRIAAGASGFASVPGARTTVLFTTGNQVGRDVGFSNPAQYCQDAPQVVANVYSNGNPHTATGSAGSNAWLVRAPFTFTPDTNPANFTVADGQVIGSTFGLAYQRSTDSLFASAFLKRHSGLGAGDNNPVVPANENTDETGAIYRIVGAAGAGPVASIWLDLQAQGIVTGSVARIENGATSDFEAPPTVASSPNIDADAFDKVGKVGLGAVALSEDERTLWVVNLNNRQLYEVPITITAGVPAANTAGIVAHNVGGSAAAPTCTNGLFRPFAVKVMDGFVYVGGVCTAENAGGTAANLRAAVLRHDPSGAVGSFTSVASFPIDYTRGDVSNSGAANTPANWRPWRTAWTDIVAPAPGAATFGQVIQPQPILSDIEFDVDGTMVLSFIDRFSHQSGNNNYSSLAVDGSPRTVYEAAAGGETLLACFNTGTGQYDLETAGGCGGRVSDSSVSGQGPGGGEYFWHDKFDGYPPTQTVNAGGHRESTLGGASIHSVRREMVSSIFDPRSAFRAAGWRVFNLIDFDTTATNNAGENARSVEIFGQDAGGGRPVRFGKAAGIGNVELLCNPPPIEIGNRVWFDSDHDGVQDASEVPLANVALVLYSAAGTQLGRTTTNANGEWYFTLTDDAIDPSNTDADVRVADPYFLSYFVVIDPVNFNAAQPLFGFLATARDADASANGDARDSDGGPVAVPVIGARLGFNVTVGGPGANDHRIDFGFGTPDRGDLPDTGAGVGTGNYETLSASGGPSHPIVPGLQIGTNIDGEADGQPSVNADGDDVAGAPDDEDGLNVTALQRLNNLIAGGANAIPVTVTNTTGVAAQLCGFVDFNADGDFVDAGETQVAAVANGSVGATATLTFTPPIAQTGVRYARFRLSTDASACSANGAASNGEVEDYPATIRRVDFGDLPDTSAATGAGDYTTDRGFGFVGHEISTTATTLFLGASVDAEGNGAQSIAADGDDTALVPDDEDGLSAASLNQTVGLPGAFSVTVTNTIPAGPVANLCGYADWNGDGDFGDVNEAAAAVILSGTTAATAVLNFGTVPAGSAGNRYLRLRYTTASCAVALPTDSAVVNGEVEDYRILVGGADFGDLPDTAAGVGAGNYETLLANGGPVHPIIAGLLLGANEDAELNGQPNAAGTGDDTTGAPDDEDGIDVADLALTVGVAPAVDATVTNTSGIAARLCGFIDYNADGDFADAGESASVAVANGTNNGAAVLNFGAVALGSAPTTHARFRLSTDTAGVCGANGVATNGEVEDYTATVATPADFGDLPDSGAGVGAGNYETLSASGGPSHPLVAGLRLGAAVDAEANGQPNAAANGDDTTGAPDDEDGVDVADLAMTVGIAPAVDVTATNTTGSAARVCGFIDYNADGDFADAGESAAAAVAAGTNNGTFVLNFGAVPFGASANTYARFRLSTDIAGICSANGAATNGEVEDYVAGIATPSDLGDLPDTGAGVGVANYETLDANGGPRHPIRTGLRMGATIDAEADGQPNVAANGDGTDEDGATVADLTLVAGSPATVRVSATNSTGTAARICGFVDFNGDGDFVDAGEATQIAVPDGTNGTVTLNFGTVPGTAVASSYARFRLSTATSACTAIGAEADGEVEDYPVSATRFDLGDLPDGGAGVGAANYQTLVADGGARHTIVAGLYLGATVDAEGDGQPDAGATGDDNTGTPDDEDGVTFPPAGFELGSPANVSVIASNSLPAAATVCGFIDWNGDGDFDDASERAQSAVASGASNASATLAFGNAPASVAAAIYARFRISGNAVCAPAGDAPDGEVEDYVVPTTGNGALSLGNLVWEDIDNDGRVDAGEPGIAGVTVNLYRDDDQNCVPDGTAIGTQPTGASGNYLFIDLLPGGYVVEIAPPTIFIGSTGTGRYLPIGPFEPAPDPDNDVDNDDNGTASTTVIRSCAVSLVPKAEPINDGDADTNSNLSVDFGLVRNFDLALRKRLSPGQAAVVAVGDTVSFTITVYNQGTIAATNIQLTDFIPPNMALNDTAWVASGGVATRTIAGPLAPGANTSVTIGLRITGASAAGYRNLAEISDAQDDTGVVRTDKDSVPDGNGNNDGPPTDDELDNSNSDEDDSDFAGVSIPQSIPGNAAWAMLLLALALLMVAGLRLRGGRVG